MTTTVHDQHVNASRITRYTELVARKRAIETELNLVKREIEEVEEALLTEMSETGLSRVTANGYTLAIRRELWATCAGGDYERAAAALRAAGLSEFVQERFNSQTLSAYCRELDRDGRPLPVEFEGAIQVAEVFKIRATKIT